MRRRIINYCIACGLPLPPSGLCRRYQCREEAKRRAELARMWEGESVDELEDEV